MTHRLPKPLLVVALSLSSFVVQLLLFDWDSTTADGWSILRYAGTMLVGMIGIALAGYFLANRTGFQTPVISRWLGRESLSGIKRILLTSAVWGIGLAIAAVSLDVLFFQGLILKKIVNIGFIEGLGIAYSAAVGEEILFRLFGMSFLVWILRAWKYSATFAIPLSIALSSIVFAMGHLPLDASAWNPSLALRALLLNGGAGIVFGWLYWKRGLESAMIAHFLADVSIYSILPMWI